MKFLIVCNFRSSLFILSLLGGRTKVRINKHYTSTLNVDTANFSQSLAISTNLHGVTSQKTIVFILESHIGHGCVSSCSAVITTHSGLYNLCS